jgi:hypothetical protein
MLLHLRALQRLALVSRRAAAREPSAAVASTAAAAAVQQVHLRDREPPSAAAAAAAPARPADADGGQRLAVGGQQRPAVHAQPTVKKGWEKGEQRPAVHASRQIMPAARRSRHCTTRF